MTGDQAAIIEIRVFEFDRTKDLVHDFGGKRGRHGGGRVAGRVGSIESRRECEGLSGANSRAERRESEDKGGKEGIRVYEGR